MPRHTSGVNKSEEIRNLLRANPGISAKETVGTLAAKNITVTDSLFYYIKGKMKGRRSRHRRAQQIVARVATTTGEGDAVKTILKVKALASELGGLKRLKALVDVLSE